MVTRNDDWGSKLRTESIAAFDTAGSLRWWRQLSVPYDGEDGFSRGPKHVVPAPWGGIFVVWVHANDDFADCGMVRYNAEGMALYGLGQAMGWVTDFRAGPDGRYYSLEQSQWEDDEGRVVAPHLP
ncbi:hypothetical protein OV203_25380 [Nannocystis sp. ILAH1]|uniref:hypothetical protein n=1 Tax=Nannocystis sp. ILAH1 TaxID=2996789 RepID=UPI00226E9CBB|nr:hypothetical protein [Nannocystis sp. ILAH1]MCY0990499.1 hypothetical protein [Nannocystis sp. ILAH1]